MEYKSSKYKIYIDTEVGYRQLKGLFSFDDMMNFLDDHIIDKQKKDKLLVVQTSKELDYPFYLYTGDYIDYMTFRAGYYFDDKPKKRVKKME